MKKSELKAIIKEELLNEGDGYNKAAMNFGNEFSKIVERDVAAFIKATKAKGRPIAKKHGLAIEKDADNITMDLIERIWNSYL